MTEEERQQTNELRSDRKNSEKPEKQQKKRIRHRRKKLRIRLIPIWLRLIIVVVLVGGSLLLGLMFGYGVIGDGAPEDTLKPATWYHILDLMRGN